MNNTLKLPHAMSNCPTAWINFFEECCHGGPKDDKGDVTVEFINEKLLPYQARYDEPTTSLVFNSEGSLAWFYLQWG